MWHETWTIGAAALTVALSLFASGHVVLHKRDVRAALGWVTLVWLAPVAGLSWRATG